MKKIKILYAYTSFYRGGGGEMRPYVLAKNINRDKFDFNICVIENSRSELRLEIEKLECPIYDLNLSRRFYNILNVSQVVFGFYRLFKMIKPHIVQTQALHTNLLARLGAKLAGVPIIISTENSLPDIETKMVKRILNIPLYLSSNILDRVTQKILVASNSIRKMKDPKGTSHKIEVLPPFFDLDLFLSTRAELPDRQPFSDLMNPVIGVVGRLSREKGHEYLIAAMSEILTFAPRTHLVVVGSGPAETELKEQVKSLHLTKSVEFVGYKRNVFVELARMDVLFVPSLTEALGIVTLEAMAMGLPVVGTYVGGIPEVIVEGKTGILVQPGDAPALAKAFHYLMHHSEEGVQMGVQGKERVFCHFHPSKFIQKQEQIYERLVAAHIPQE